LLDVTNAFVLNAADVLILSLSILTVVVVGLLASRRQDKSARGYFLASQRMPWYVIGSAFVSTSVSSEQIVGTVGQAYQTGMGVANWEWWSLPVYSLLIVLFIPMFLRNRISTVPEFLTRRFGPLCGTIYSVVMLLAYVLVFLVPVLYGGSLAFSELTGWNFFVILWITVALVAVYAVKGGLSAVMWTDAVQCLMLLGGGIVLFFLALAKVPGGWSAMVQANPERFHLYHPPGDPIAPFLGLILGSVGVFIFYSAANQVMIQRVLGARSLWDGMMGIVFAGLINMFRPLVTCFLGFIVFHWIHELHQASPLDNPDKTFSFALATFAPQWGLRGIILAGFLAAVMSTISALANSTATIFSLDVYGRWFKPAATDRELVMAGRLASILALLIAGLLAPSVERLGGIFRYFQTGVTYLATPFITVILFGLLWKRANYSAALFGLLGGLAIQMTVALGLPAAGLKLHWIYSAFIAQVLIAVGMVAISLSTAPPPVAQWQPFQWTPQQVRELAESIRRPWYQSVGLWFGVFAACWVAVYWWFW
jgi:solute:Na+ symporter, SSS family